MRVFVTGVAGFVGSTLAEKLLARGDRVLGIDNFNDYYSPERKRKNIEPLLAHKNFRLKEGDFSTDEGLASCADTPCDCIAHMGAMANLRYSVLHPELFTQVNMVGTSKLLELARKSKIPHFVFASTSSVYGQRDQVPFVESDNTDHPLAPYPATKKAGELLGHAYHHMFGMSFTALRFFNVYGPKGRPDMMPYKATQYILEGRELEVYGDGSLLRDWTYVDDVVDGVIRAIDKPLGYEIVNLGRGEPLSLGDMLATIERVVGRQARRKVVPVPKSEAPRTFASIEKTESLLGYAPKISFEDGFDRFWKWYQGEVLCG